MRILELGKFYPPHRGGIETLLESWCEGFVGLGAEVDCVVANDSATPLRETLRGVRVHRLASWGTLFSTSVCPGYLRTTKRIQADLWHAHFPNPLADVATLFGDRNTPLVISYHSDIVRQAGLMRAYAPILNRFLDRADRIVVATPRHIEYSSWLRPRADKCEVIPFGIRLQKFQGLSGNDSQVLKLRESAGGRHILLNIGRLVGYKGQRYLLEAARALNVVVWLVGSGPLEAELHAQAGRLGLDNRVQFWGSLDEVKLSQLLQACDVFVLPSITPNEAFGLVQVEAMACGKPVVCCQLDNGVNWVNRDGETGFAVPPADPAALAAALARLQQDAALRARLGEAGRRRAFGEFTSEAMARATLSVYREVLSRL